MNESTKLGIALPKGMVKLEMNAAKVEKQARGATATTMQDINQRLQANHAVAVVGMRIKSLEDEILISTGKIAIRIYFF